MTDFLTKLGGGSGRSTVYWSRFYRDWTQLETQKIVKESIGWIIDLMMIFIANNLVKNQSKLSPHLLSYTHDFTIGIDGSAQHPQKRALGKTEHPVFQCFLITFARSENVALIWKDKDVLEVFFPYPFLNEVAGYTSGIEKVLNALQHNWLKLRAPQIKIFKFNRDFTESNIWIPLFACLRLVKSFEEIQTMFLKPELKIDLENKALLTYHSLGNNIGTCISKSSNSYYANLFGPNSKSPVSINAEQMFVVATLLNQCRLEQINYEWFNNIKPQSVSKENTSWPADIDVEKWTPFIPTPNATVPKFYF